jgi:aspartyl/asparaginyl beta-hydroxylase (cupin superfamily)
LNKRPKKLLDRVRETLRAQHYSIHTEPDLTNKKESNAAETCVRWIRRYILFHDKRHPKKMDVPEIEAFLTQLAVDQNMAASTQTRALSALLFLIKHLETATTESCQSIRPSPLQNSRQVDPEA